jgi:hypothetical protein
MPENAGVDPQGSRAARAPRGLVLVAVLALAVGLAVAANTLGGSSTQPPPRPPPADATATVSEPTPSDSLTTPSIRVETALPAIGGVALGGPRGSYLTRSDPTAVIGPWTVVVRRADGSLGRYGAVVTYPVRTNDAANTEPSIRVGSASGISGPGFILWPLGNGQARIRGDLPQADLVHIAELTTVVAGRPQVRPPEGFRVIARAPSRLPLIHEIRYGSSGLGVGPALGDGLTYTGLTSGGGFEDALYAERATPAGTVHGAAAVLSSVQGGNGTLAWEPSPGVVAYVGWSGAGMSAKAVTALRTLAEGTYILTPSQWLAAKPQLDDQENNPAK